MLFFLERIMTFFFPSFIIMAQILSFPLLYGYKQRGLRRLFPGAHLTGAAAVTKWASMKHRARD